MVKYSILICSKNGSARIEKCLVAISNLKIEDDYAVEVLLIDSNSSDNTGEYAIDIWRNLNCKFYFKKFTVLENGKIAAFNKGVQESSGEYIVVCDDDNILFNSYLIEADKLLNENKNIGVIGACGILQADDYPDWFEEFKGFYACGRQAFKTGNVFPQRNVVYGAGMIFRKSVFLQCVEKGFHFIFDYKSPHRNPYFENGGEDGELCWIIKFSGYEIWYSDNLKFLHEIDQNRLTLEYLKKLKERKSKSAIVYKLYSRMYLYEKQNVSWFWLKELLFLIKNYFSNFKFSKKYLVEETTRVYYDFISLIKLNFKYDNAANQILKYKTLAKNNCIRNV
jgi:glycosyltransferase involved in cell wall biosynthesis